MFWSDLGPKVGYEAIGIIDSTLPTVSVFAKPSKQLEEVAQTQTNETTKKATITVSPPLPQQVAAASSTVTEEEEDDFGKGVVFYLRDDKIIGIVLWNVFNRINTARAVIGEDKVYDDLNEVAKLFDIHT